ncbi:lactoylglutathione lyase [Dethiosulfatibacter aminovorans DSM 17477]|uniref:Lactoylglutathione lyase n=1 Tax=Dethiosulfatibacter aminovorans DSM 17477 TaxID=1121476 RepID=A0A1M6ACA6_9FIRM|nr:VOC family protein [Dethiosulfatibacter aminovorans]SHI34095.1 lactoylglutathione lyase [Dethiosulfatibacter aminovorans DSM 17477]
MKFGHIGIKVLDMERSLDFYKNILEAKILKDHSYPRSRIVFLEVGGTIIELIGKKKNREREMGPIEHIAFKVDSLEEKMEMLTERGIEFSDVKVVGSAKLIFFLGPDNERFEFVARVEK